MENLEGYYAKKKNGKTLFSFEWSTDGQLFIIQDDGKKVMVDKDEYEILNMCLITADSTNL